MLMTNLQCNISDIKVLSDPHLVIQVCPFALVLLIRKNIELLDEFCALEYNFPECQFCGLIPIMPLSYECSMEVEHYSPSENLAQCSY